MNKNVEKEFYIVNRLKAALVDCELTLYYQPIVTASDGEIHGVEALLRWPQKNGEILFPDEFIHVAEKNNLNLSHREIDEFSIPESRTEINNSLKTIVVSDGNFIEALKYDLSSFNVVL